MNSIIKKQTTTTVYIVLKKIIKMNNTLISNIYYIMIRDDVMRWFIGKMTVSLILMMCNLFFQEQRILLIKFSYINFGESKFLSIA